MTRDGAREDLSRALAEFGRALAGAGFGNMQARRDPLPHERQSGRIYVTATALP